MGAASGRGVAGFECGGEGAEGGEVGLGEFGVVVADGQGGRRAVRGDEVEDGVGVDAVDGVVAGGAAGNERGGRVGEADGATGPEGKRLGVNRPGQAGGVPGDDVEEGVVGGRAARATAEVGFEADGEGGPGVVGAGLEVDPVGGDEDVRAVVVEAEQGGLVGVGVGVGQGGEAGEFAGLKAGAEPGVEDVGVQPADGEDEGGDGQEGHADAGGHADLAAAAGVVGVGLGHWRARISRGGRGAKGILGMSMKQRTDVDIGRDSYWRDSRR